MTTERWEIDSAHSGIHFNVRHMVIAKVRGQFSRWSGTVLVPDGDFSRASVEVVIDASSIDTGVADRDNHLRSADFFDVQTYPELTFKSTRVDGDGDSLAVIGDLTIHGVTRQVTLAVELEGKTRDPWGNERAGFSAKTSVSRKDFGLTWNQLLETGGVVVGDKINIEIEVEAVRQALSQVA
ncbi:MAG: YceI family protein [Deltaproteobacteria bacterium]|nr:YceI family protein [Deltaproteobacteria bacterium]